MTADDRGRVIAAWEGAAAAALAEGASREDVLAALAFGLVLAATGTVEAVGREARLAVLRRGRRVLLATGARGDVEGREGGPGTRGEPGDSGETGAREARDGRDAGDEGGAVEAEEALAALRALAARGLRALSGEADLGPPSAERSREAEDGERPAARRAPGEDLEWHPSVAALVAMTRGAPDPVSAADVAGHVLGCAACALGIAVLADRDARASGAGASRVGDLAGRRPASPGMALPRLRVAAADAGPGLRSPEGGTTVAVRRAPDAEAVRFDEDDGSRRLAVYVTERAPVRLEGDGVVTEAMAPGYWCGRLAPELVTVDVRLHVGDVAVPWRFDADAEEPAEG